MFAGILSRVLNWLHKNDSWVQVNEGCVVKVAELMKPSLSKPTPKQKTLKGADGEILPLITVRCEDDF